MAIVMHCNLKPPDLSFWAVITSVA